MGLLERARRRVWPHGPALTAVTGLAIVLGLGILAVGIGFFTSREGAAIGLQYAASQAYAFDRLTLRTSYLEIDVEAGFLVPVLSRGEICGAVVFGLGWAHLCLPPDLAAELAQALGTAEFREDFEAMYIPASYESLARLRLACSARNVDHQEYPGLAQDLLDRHPEDPGLLPYFRAPAAAGPVQSPTAIRLRTVTYGRVDYLEGPRIALDLSLPLRRVLSFPNPDQSAAPAFPHLYVTALRPITVLLFILLTGLLGVLCLVLTLHLREPRWASRSATEGSGLPVGARLGTKSAYVTLAGPIAVLALTMAHRGVGAGLLGKSYPPWVGEALIGAAVLCWAVRRRIPAAHLGFTTRAVHTAIGAGVLVGFYAVVASATGYPGGFRNIPWEHSVLTTIRVMLVSAPLRELALRAFAQTSLERYTGKAIAVLLPAATAGVSYLLGSTALFGRAYLHGPLLTEGLLLVPAAHALAGYLYRRTRNLASPVLVTGLVELLPKILTF